MRIGILTLQASDNCGSLLQAYALQNILVNKYNHEVRIINFSSHNGRKMYRILHPSYLKTPKKFLFSILEYKELKSQRGDYEVFRKKYLKLTSKIYKDLKSLRTIDDEFDVIIAGSDQIWNIGMYDFDDAFFLTWVQGAKKIAYAASLGDQGTTNNFEINYKNYIDALNKFKLISTREEISQKCLSSLLGSKVNLCVDPTLLVPSSHWKNLAGDCQIKSNYIFYYSYNYADDAINLMVKKIANYYKLPVIVINRSKWIGKRNKMYDFDLYPKAGPLIFLNLMKYASVTLVESFHGIIFSYIMNKDFWFMKRNSDSKLDDRIDSILTLLECKERVINSDTGEQFFNHINRIDYGRKLDNLERLQKDSFHFLKSI